MMEKLTAWFVILSYTYAGITSQDSNTAFICYMIAFVVLDWKIFTKEYFTKKYLK